MTKKHKQSSQSCKLQLYSKSTIKLPKQCWTTSFHYLACRLETNRKPVKKIKVTDKQQKFFYYSKYAIIDPFAIYTDWIQSFVILKESEEASTKNIYIYSPKYVYT